MEATTENNISAQGQPIYDVIISGAGPVGLFLACELALAQCSVLILEKAENAQSPLKQLPFGIRGLNAPSIEAMYRRGLLQEFELHKHFKNPHTTSTSGHGSKPQAGGHFAGIQFNNDNIDASQWKYRLPGTIETSIMSEMQEIETVLAHRAKALGVTIVYGCAIIDFQQDEDGVTVGAGGRSFQGKWLVGCDGSRSIIRKLGGFQFAGTEPEFTGYTVMADINDPDKKLRTGRNLTSTGMYMQSQPGYLIMQDFDAGAFHDSGKLVTLQYVQELLRRISETDVTITALHTATTWTDRSRQATTYRNGKVLLAGDAAHIHSPLGGQGLNLGLGDAMNLGWKLAATILQKATEGLLDSYYTERHPIGAQVLNWSRAQVAVMRPDPAARALHAVIRDLVNTCDGATYFAGRVWGVNTHYSFAGSHPMVGYSVPDFEFEDGTRIGQFMHDGMGILLDFDSNVSLENLASEYSVRLKYISASAKDRLALSAVLIRPDGIIAWASGDEPDHGELQKAVARWFVSTSGIKD